VQSVKINAEGGRLHDEDASSTAYDNSEKLVTRPFHHGMLDDSKLACSVFRCIELLNLEVPKNFRGVSSDFEFAVCDRCRGQQLTAPSWVTAGVRTPAVWACKCAR